MYAIFSVVCSLALLCSKYFQVCKQSKKKQNNNNNIKPQKNKKRKKKRYPAWDVMNGKAHVLRAGRCHFYRSVSKDTCHLKLEAIMDKTQKSCLWQRSQDKISVQHFLTLKILQCDCVSNLELSLFRPSGCTQQKHGAVLRRLATSLTMCLRRAAWMAGGYHQ